MKKIFFFLSQPIEKFNYDRFCFDLFLKKGFEPVYVDLSNYFLKRDHKYRFKSKIKVINIKTIKDFVFFLKSEQNNKFYYIDLTSYNSLIFNLFQKILSFRGCIKLHISTSIVTSFHLLNVKEKFLLYLKNFEILKIFASTFRNLRRRINNLFRVDSDYAFISGRQELKIKKFNNSVTLSSSLDYNEYLEIKKNKKKIKANQIVYLDQNLLYHREFYVTKEGYLNKKNFLEFYNKLKIFLDDIHNKKKCKIVICLHPRCKSEGFKFLKKKFNSPQYIFSRDTSLEIQKSKLVILNYSNAHQLAVLYKKPMLIVHNFSKKYFDYEVKNKVINTISKNLGVPILNFINNKPNFKISYKYNKKKYEKYILNYLSSVYPKKISSWNIVINKLKEIKL